MKNKKYAGETKFAGIGGIGGLSVLNEDYQLLDNGNSVGQGLYLENSDRLYTLVTGQPNNQHM